MSNAGAPVRDALDDKVNRLFAGKVVRKDLVRKVKVGANVPVFVLEFLLGKYCASSDELAMLKPLQLLTVKPILYAANVTDAELSGSEGPHLKRLRAAVAASEETAEVVPFSAKIEAELAELSMDDRAAFLESLGLESAGLDRLIRSRSLAPS